MRREKQKQSDTKTTEIHNKKKKDSGNSGNRGSSGNNEKTLKPFSIRP